MVRVRISDFEDKVYQPAESKKITYNASAMDGQTIIADPEEDSIIAGTTVDDVKEYTVSAAQPSSFTGRDERQLTHVDSNPGYEETLQKN